MEDESATTVYLPPAPMSNAEVTVTCPDCKQPFTLPGQQFEACAELVCPACEHAFDSDTTRLQPALERIEKKLRGMRDLL